MSSVFLKAWGPPSWWQVSRHTEKQKGSRVVGALGAPRGQLAFPMPDRQGGGRSGSARQGVSKPHLPGILPAHGRKRGPDWSSCPALQPSLGDG